MAAGMPSSTETIESSRGIGLDAIDQSVPVWDAVVIGAGVAGASAARLLARRGFSILLVERKTFPRYKVCGCCLNLRSQRILDAIGAGAPLRESGATKLHSVTLYSGGRRAALPLPGGLAVSRNTLDTTLIRLAGDAGAVVSQGVSAMPSPKRTSIGWRLALSDAAREVEIEARLIIAADGLGGHFSNQLVGSAPRVAKNGYIGLGALAPGCQNSVISGDIHMVCGKQGYVGYVRVENGQLALAAAVPREFVRESGGAADCLRKLFQDAGHHPPTELSALRWTGTPQLTRQTKRMGMDGLVLLGDAAGYIEPFTGEGMAWALEGARLLDAHLGDSTPEQWAGRAVAWDKVYRKAMGPKGFLCRCITASLRLPGATTTAVGVLSRIPLLSRPLVLALNHSKGP